MKRLLLCITCLFALTFVSSRAAIIEVAPAGAWMGTLGISGGAPPVAGGCSESDNFDRTNEDPLGNSTWETIDGSGVEIISNVFKRNDTDSTYHASAWLESDCNFSDDQYGEIDIGNPTGANDSPGIILRAQDAVGGGDYYLAKWHYNSGGTDYYEINKVVNGTPTQMAIPSYAALSGGETMRFEVTTNGSNADFVLKIDGTTVTNGTVSDTSSVITGGQPGVLYWYGDNATVTGDNFAAGDL